MSLFSMAFAGGGFILLGSWESLCCSSSSKTQRFSTITLLSTAFLSLLFIINSLLSLSSSLSSHDHLGPTLQLQVLAVSSLFGLFSILGLYNNLSKAPIFPYQLISLILLFAFIEEFLLFYLQLKDTIGVENRYYDLMLVPISICVFSTIVELKDSSFNSNSGVFPKLGRGFGLILQGTWFVQMGFSFFSDLIANNCELHSKSRGNYTIKCKSHMDYHRGGAIAVLLFNCHLALLVTLICLVYSAVGKRFVARRDHGSYRRIGETVLRVENEGSFTLDSDEDEVGVDDIKQAEGSEGPRRGNGYVELVVNGYGGTH